jgi:muramoyltetrapeptide carboxypeptidase LdcA involved in peptidoglycan recycling
MLDLAGGMDGGGKPRRIPLRPTFELSDSLRRIFGRVASSRGIALYGKMPVGHGPNYWPLPLGARARIDEAGRFKLLAWDWLSA